MAHAKRAPRTAAAVHMAGSGEPVDLERFLGVLEGVRTVPFSGVFRADGRFHAPYTGPGVHLLLGGPLPDDMDAGDFWSTRILPDDQALYRDGMARQQRGEPCHMEYRVVGLDARVRWIRECTRSTPQAGGMRIDGIVTDVSDQRERADSAAELEDALRETRGRLDSVLSALDEYLYAWRYPLHGPSVIDFESIPLAEFLGREQGSGTPVEEWLDALHPDDHRRIIVEVLAAQVAGRSGSAEYRVCDSEGRVRWLLDSWRCRRDEGGILAEGIVTDVTERREAQDGLASALADARVAYGELEEARLAAERASNTDPLTGLANRRSFQRSLERAIAEAAREPFGLLLLDVDHFKRVNDTHGHQAGDDLLVAVVACLHAALPPHALVGRWGGEEFTVLVRGVRGRAALRKVAESIRLAVRDRPLTTRRGPVQVTISCGGVLSAHGADDEALVHAADAAMYRTKQAGRDRTLLAGDAAEDELAA